MHGAGNGPQLGVAVHPHGERAPHRRGPIPVVRQLPRGLLERRHLRIANLEPMRGRGDRIDHGVIVTIRLGWYVALVTVISRHMGVITSCDAEERFAPCHALRTSGGGHPVVGGTGRNPE